MRYSDHRVIVRPLVQFLDPIVTRDENKIISFDAWALEMDGEGLTAIGRFDVEDRRFSAETARDYEFRTLFSSAKQSGFEQFSQAASPTDQLYHRLPVELFSNAKALGKRSRLAFCHSPHTARAERARRFVVVISQS